MAQGRPTPRPGLIARTTARLLAIPFLTFASSLAPQHVHQPSRGQDHPIAHSHFAPHNASVPGKNDGTEIEHDIERVVYVDSSFLGASTIHISPALSATAISHETVCTLARWTVIPSDDFAPSHGPPKRHVLFRGPPSLLV
jgi:hypothetical protein